MKAKKTQPNAITSNRRARHDYTIESDFEAGVVLEGWEVKSLRSGRGQLTESYVMIKRGEVWLINAHITPLSSASNHVKAVPTRTRKLLLHRREISTLLGKVERRGYTLIPLMLYWGKNNVKLRIGLAKGKTKYDKREAQKDKDWSRQRQRLLKGN